MKDLDEYNKFLEIYNQYKSFAGFLFWDEPGIVDFPNVKRINQLSKASKLPEKLIYVNLLPMYASANQFWSGAGEKEIAKKEIDTNEYLEEYINCANPEYISYDFYPFEGEFPAIHPDLYKQYSIVNRLAIKNNIPTYCFIQLVSFNENTRIPTFKEISFHVNTSLAYNVKGIQYFTYFLPVNENVEFFKGAMINHNGEVTDVYKSVKRINLFIKLIQSNLISSIWKGISAPFSANIPADDRILLDYVQIETEKIITGVFEKTNSHLLYCVNTSLSESDEYKLLFFKNKDLLVYHQNDLTKTIIQNTKSFMFSLEPGEAKMIEIYKV